MATTTDNLSGDFSSPPKDFTTYLGETLVNTNGYSGTLEFTGGNSSIPQYEDTDTPSAGNISWMGTLELGSVGSASVSILISTNSTDLGLLNYNSSNCAQNIFLYGTNNSLSMSSYDYTQGAKGESLDLSGSNIYTWDTSSGSGQWDFQPVTIFGTQSGNDTFTGSSGTNILYEGNGNSTFHQSAGSDLIDCTGGNSVYYAKDAASSYQGGWENTSTGQTYLNSGEDWLFTENGKTIELINVPSVYFDGVEYTSSVNNPTPAASNSASSASTASDTRAGTTAAPTAADMSDVVSQQSLHQSMLADFGTLGLGHTVLHGAAHGTFGGAETLVMSPALAGYTGLLTTSSHQATTAVDHHGSLGPLSHLG